MMVQRLCPAEWAILMRQKPSESPVVIAKRHRCSKVERGCYRRKKHPVGSLFTSALQLGKPEVDRRRRI